MPKQTARRAFSLIELLVSIAIIAILTGLSIAAYGRFTAKAQNTRCVELVHQARTALEHLYQRDDAWPRPLLAEASGGDGKLDSVAGAQLAKAGVMSLTYRAEFGRHQVLQAHRPRPFRRRHAMGDGLHHAPCRLRRARL